jgi:hypothetical protein
MNQHPELTPDQVPDSVHIVLQLDALNRKITYLNAVVTVLALVAMAGVGFSVFMMLHTAAAGLD